MSGHELVVLYTVLGTSAWWLALIFVVSIVGENRRQDRAIAARTAGAVPEPLPPPRDVTTDAGDYHVTPHNSYHRGHVADCVICDHLHPPRKATSS